MVAQGRIEASALAASGSSGIGFDSHRSFAAIRSRCLQPRQRSVVWMETWPRRNWIWSSSSPARGDEGLVGVTFEPWRPGPPFREGSVSIPDWHFYFRQTLGVEDLVLRDDIVYIEQ